MIRIDAIWLALGASDLRGGIDRLLALVVQGFALGAQAHHARGIRKPSQWCNCARFDPAFLAFINR